MAMKVSRKEFNDFLNENNVEHLIEWEERKGQNCIAKDFECECGKDVYITYNDAEKALKQRKGKNGDKVIYKCPLCGYWHLHSKSRAPQEMKKKYDKNKKTKNYKNKLYYYASNSMEEVRNMEPKNGHSLRAFRNKYNKTKNNGDKS